MIGGVNNCEQFGTNGELVPYKVLWNSFRLRDFNL